MVRLGLLEGDPAELIKEETYKKFYMHRLGHYIGMDVHDVGGMAKPIPAGAVFTIEPGIYIPEENLGVRIEDDYLATDKGLVKLSGKLPSDPDEIERMMMSAPPAAAEQRSSKGR
jgi:Xaa-Pro aminopeptidase